MRKFLLLIIPLCLFACSKPEWTKTSNGVYIYGKLPKNKEIIWEGDTIGPLASGKADIVIIDKQQIIKRENVTTELGAITEYKYTPTSLGLYLGKQKKQLPHGFGALIKNDTLFLGEFKKGILYTGKVEIAYIKNDKVIPCYSGLYENGKPNGQGIMYQNEQSYYTGSLRNGEKHGFGQEYHNSVKIFEGSFKKGKRHGTGKEFYDNGQLAYDGEWSKDLRDGYGTLYNDNGLIVYMGEWKNGQYNGKGKLYENGKCLEGKWDEGRLTKSISTSAIKEVINSTKTWFSDIDSLKISNTNNLEQYNIPTSQIEFIEQLNSELEKYISSEFEIRVEKRFGIWHIFRMIIQPWFKSDIRRADKAQNFFCKNINSTEIERIINSKIDYFNKNSSNNQLHYVKLQEIPKGVIVDTNVALKIFEREAMETTDILTGLLADILITVVIGFIIGFIIGLFFPLLIPICATIDTILAIVGVIVGIWLSFVRTTPISIALEDFIQHALTDNYMLFLESQNIILQITGLL